MMVDSPKVWKKINFFVFSGVGFLPFFLFIFFNPPKKEKKGKKRAKKRQKKAEKRHEKEKIIKKILKKWLKLGVNYQKNVLCNF